MSSCSNHYQYIVLVALIDQKLTSQVHEIVGRINGKFGTLTAVPIHHLVCLYLINFCFYPINYKLINVKLYKNLY
jgi:trehalose 6-phosphate synthase/phosphatase